MIDEEFKKWLLSPIGGCVFMAKDIGDGLYAGVKPLLFHWTLIIGQIGDRVGIEDNYCYPTHALALAALEAWDGTGEPTDWHRHPRTGRRRPGGDPAKEYKAA